MDLYALIEKYVVDTRDSINKAKADGITLSEASEIAGDAIRRLVTLANELNVSGPEKKRAVMDAAGKLYDTLIAPLDIPKIPEFVEARFVDPLLKQVWLEVISGVVETFVKMLKLPIGD